MRHATRIGVVAVPAVSFSALWGTRYEYWLTITLVLTMQPFFSLTLARALERIGGTVLGGIVGAVIAALCQTPLAMLAAIFPLALFAVAIRQVSFGLFMMAVTPIVVLLSELEQASVSSWALAGTRALFTLAGGTLALAACLFLWPSWEPDRLRREARAAIAAHGRYAALEFTAMFEAVPNVAVEQVRRAAGVASNNLEASLSRALQEPSDFSPFRLEAAMVIDAALRRMGGRLAAMQLEPEARQDLDPEEWRVWRDWFANSMEAMANNPVLRSLPPQPPLPRAGESHAVARMARQAELISGALKRLHGIAQGPRTPVPGAVQASA